MAQLKRSRFFSIGIDDSRQLDLTAFLRGQVSMNEVSRLQAFSAVSGARFPVSADDLAGLVKIPTTRWVSRRDALALSALTEERLDTLTRTGALISDGPDDEERQLRERAERLDALQWHPNAALYHFATQLEEAERTAGPLDVASLSVSSEEIAREVVSQRGAPPPEFHHREGQLVDLPEGQSESDSGFFELLGRRRTVRGFDPSRPMSRDALATMLRWVFGAHGKTQLAPEVTLLHKTSPSGGALHPIEVYPVVLRVEGLEPGIYHYDVEHHALRCLGRRSREALQELAIRSSRNQLYVGEAHALFILTARWRRNFWKYRHSSRTYSVILKDVGHLSQTFYLAAAELGLGAFYTGAILAAPLETVLSLQPEEEGVLGICGCGTPSSENDLGLPFEICEPEGGRPAP